MKILFWLLIAADTLVLGMFFVLGLAAATSTKQSGFAVATSLPFALPALVLIAAILLFTRSPSAVGRGAGLLLAAAPALLLIWMRGTASLAMRQNSNRSGEIAHFRAGPLREIADAIKINSDSTVARLAPAVDVNTRGFMDVTLLMLALRHTRVLFRHERKCATGSTHGLARQRRRHQSHRQERTVDRVRRRKHE